MTEPVADQGRRAGQRPRGAALLGVLLVALAGLAVGLGITRSGGPPVTAGGSLGEQQAVLAAARDEGAALTTLSWRSATTDLDRILAGALPKGQLYRQFAAQRSRLPAVLAQHHSVSQGSVLASGLSSLTGSTATALVAVDANISGSNGSPTVKHYRMVFAMQRVGSKWLAKTVSFQGPPQ